MIVLNRGQWWRLLAVPVLWTAVAAAVAVWPALALGRTGDSLSVEGYLERGLEYSRLYEVSPESGDLVVYVFANDSQAGLVIFNRCLSDLLCHVSGARVYDLDDGMMARLRLEWATGASAMFWIDLARGAQMEDSLPLEERFVETRFGWLSVDDHERLLFDGQLVRAPLERPSSAEPLAGQRWWSPGLQRLRQGFAWTGLLSDDTSPSETGMPGDDRGEAIEGMWLHIVAGMEMGSRDIVLLRATGGTACPALYRVVTLSADGVSVTPEFGSCSDIANVWVDELDDQALVVVMPGYRGPFESESERATAVLQKHVFRFRDGVVTRAVRPAAGE